MTTSRSDPAAAFVRERFWKFERIDGSHVYAVGSEVELDEAGYVVRGERLGWCPYQTWTDEVSVAR